MTNWLTFGGLTASGVGAIDQNDLTLAGMASVPVAITGKDTLTLTGAIAGLGFSAYQNYVTFFGIAAQTNDGAVTATFGSLGALNVYKDTSSGPVALTGSEIIANNAVWLTYDSALNTGGGGFHMQTGPAVLLAGYLPLAGGTLTGKLLLPSLALPAASAVSITSILSAAASLTPGSLLPGATSDSAVTITGVAVGDTVAVGTPATQQAGVDVQAFVSATNVVTFRFFNFTPASTLTPTGGTYRAVAMRAAP